MYTFPTYLLQLRSYLKTQEGIFKGKSVIVCFYNSEEESTTFCRICVGFVSEIQVMLPSGL